MWDFDIRIGSIKAAVLLGCLAGPAAGKDFTAGVVVEEMSPADQYTFVSGIVEGLATARMIADDGDTKARGCIYHWFYEGENAMNNVLAAFAYFPDKLPGRVVHAMTVKECGE